MYAVRRKTLLLAALAATAAVIFGPRLSAGQDARPRAVLPEGVTQPEVSEIDAMALLVRGMTQHRLGHVDRALEALRNAILIAPGEPAIASVLANVYADISDLASAEYYARLAVATDSNAAYVHQLARILDSQGRRDEAAALLRRAGLSPADSPIVAPAATASDNRAETPTAKDVLDTDVVTVVRYLANDSTEQAVPLARRLVDEHPREQEHWRLYATALLRTGDAAGAERVAREGATLFPGSVDLHITWARAAHLVGGAIHGALVLNAVTQLAAELKGQPRASLLSYASLLTNDDQLADSLARAAVATDKSNVIGHSVLASLAAIRGDLADAEGHIRHTTAPGPHEWEAALMLGTTLNTMGYDSRAREVLRIAIGSPFAAIRDSARSLIEQ